MKIKGKINGEIAFVSVESSKEKIMPKRDLKVDYSLAQLDNLLRHRIYPQVEWNLPSKSRECLDRAVVMAKSYGYLIQFREEKWIFIKG